MPVIVLASWTSHSTLNIAVKILIHVQKMGNQNRSSMRCQLQTHRKKRELIWVASRPCTATQTPHSDSCGLFTGCLCAMCMWPCRGADNTASRPNSVPIFVCEKFTFNLSNLLFRERLQDKRIFRSEQTIPFYDSSQARTRVHTPFMEFSAAVIRAEAAQSGQRDSSCCIVQNFKQFIFFVVVSLFLEPNKT